MKTLRTGDSGAEVQALQKLLNAHGAKPQLVVDGAFGRNTELAVCDFQKARKVYVDGVVGPLTWSLLGNTTRIMPDPEQAPLLRRIKVSCTPSKGYDHFTLREDVAARLECVKAQLEYYVAALTSSGAHRALTAKVGANRSATSFHYTGRAFDLFVYSAMHDLENDPYLCERSEDDPRRFTVWARAQRGELRTIKAWHHPSQKAVEISAKVINLTALLGRFGFMPIRARPTYSKTNYGAAEWWHFQDETDLVPNVTTFGSELLKVYKLKDLQDSPPWRYRDRIFKVDWF